MKKRYTKSAPSRLQQSRLLHSLLASLRRSIPDLRPLRAGARVGVAVSGGADSVALLLLLIQLREKLGVVLAVLHFNHQLRGKASDADEHFVAKLAARHGLEFHVGRDDVAAKAKREKANLEDAARRARYQFFAQLAEKENFASIAVAHTADDQAETVLAHLLRGSGLAGLAGIHPASGPIIRPLLHTRRADLRAYLRARKQPWREDASNRDTTKTRARIRATLLPLLEKHFQPAVVQHLCSLAELAREDEACLESAAEKQTALLVQKQGARATIDLSALLAPSPVTHPLVSTGVDSASHSASHSASPPLQSTSLTRRIIRHIVKQLKPRAGQLGAQHVQNILDLAEHGENGKSLPLPGGVEVRRDHRQLIFSLTSPKAAQPHSETSKFFEKKIDFAGSKTQIAVPCLARVFRFTNVDWPAKTGETGNTNSVLDRHTLRAPIVLRSWLPGDRFQPAGHRKAHKLKRLLNQQRISRWDRDGWPVLTSAGVLVWVRGFPVAHGFAASESTKVGLVIAEENIS